MPPSSRLLSGEPIFPGPQAPMRRPWRIGPEDASALGPKARGALNTCFLGTLALGHGQAWTLKSRGLGALGPATLDLPAGAGANAPGLQYSVRGPLGVPIQREDLNLVYKKVLLVGTSRLHWLLWLGHLGLSPHPAPLRRPWHWLRRAAGRCTLALRPCSAVCC